jgi:hypothetical protein
MKSIVTVFILVILSLQINAEEKVSLAGLKPIKARVGHGQLHAFTDGNCAEEGRPPLSCVIDGSVAQTGLYAHADSEVVYEIPKGTQRFEAFGATNANLPNVGNTRYGPRFLGTWAYEIWVDGKKLYESSPFFSYEKRSFPITVSIPKGAKQITLKTTMLGNDNYDWSIWAEPYFVKP